MILVNYVELYIMKAKGILITILKEAKCSKIFVLSIAVLKLLKRILWSVGCQLCRLSLLEKQYLDIVIWNFKLSLWLLIRRFVLLCVQFCSRHFPVCLYIKFHYVGFQFVCYHSLSKWKKVPSLKYNYVDVDICGLIRTWLVKSSSKCLLQ